jgi:hypothetical protein
MVPKMRRLNEGWKKGTACGFSFYVNTDFFESQS